jgi:hypothetical protein
MGSNVSVLAKLAGDRGAARVDVELRSFKGGFEFGNSDKS